MSSHASSIYKDRNFAGSLSNMCLCLASSQFKSFPYIWSGFFIFQFVSIPPCSFTGSTQQAPSPSGSFSVPAQIFAHIDNNALNFLFCNLNSPISLILSLIIRIVSNPQIISVILFKSHPSMSMSFLYWRALAWTDHSACSLARAKVGELSPWICCSALPSGAQDAAGCRCKRMHFWTITFIACQVLLAMLPPSQSPAAQVQRGASGPQRRQ